MYMLCETVLSLLYKYPKLWMCARSSVGHQWKVVLEPQFPWDIFGSRCHWTNIFLRLILFMLLLISLLNDSDQGCSGIAITISRSGCSWRGRRDDVIDPALSLNAHGWFILDHSQCVRWDCSISCSIAIWCLSIDMNRSCFGSVRLFGAPRGTHLWKSWPGMKTESQMIGWMNVGGWVA